jgi:enoyl-CoA hydratase
MDDFRRHNSPTGQGPVSVSRPAKGVLLLVMNRPDQLNALSKGLLGELAAVLKKAEGDPEIGCVVITGSGKAFSAGADIKDMVKRGVESYLDRDRLDPWQAIERFAKPLIAAVNGYALGGGCELALLCDFIIASEKARFGQPELNIGVLPGDGGTQRLPRLVGKPRAMKMILTGEMIDARQAQEYGLVLELAPPDELVNRAVAIAEDIASKPPIAVRLAKQAILQTFERPLREGLLYEREVVRQAFETEDLAEGMRAFVEKRRPDFKGR